jgi:two-component system sensor histidine kinase UhpB
MPMGSERERRSGFGRLPLVWQLFVPNAAVLIVAGAALILSPATISSPTHLTEALVLVLGLAAMLAVNLLIISRTVAPLGQLTRVMRDVDPLRPGQRVAIESGGEEIVELAAGFNRMLERIETERRDSGRRMLAAQESERRRIARELHDEIGQTVTGLMLEVGNAAGHAPSGLAGELHEVQEEARSLSEDLQKIVRRLRPDALDDLGLGSALTHLGQNFSERFGIRVTRDLANDLPALDPETELVVYRVAQEALTNVARHSGASVAELQLAERDGSLQLRVRDDGRGIDGAPPGTGIRGMRERALLLGASLTISPAADAGTEVRLDLPLAR